MSYRIICIDGPNLAQVMISEARMRYADGSQKDKMRAVLVAAYPLRESQQCKY